MDIVIRTSWGWHELGFLLGPLSLPGVFRVSYSGQGLQMDHSQEKGRHDGEKRCASSALVVRHGLCPVSTLGAQSSQLCLGGASPYVPAASHSGFI